ncbi:MAG: hypothetical protein ACREO1_04525 [Arenimonas sp.]
MRNFGQLALLCFSLSISLPTFAQGLPSPTLQICDAAYSVDFSEELIKRFNISDKFQPLSACFEENATKMSLHMPAANLHIDFFRSKTDGVNRIEMMQIEYADKPDRVVLDKMTISENIKNLVSVENRGLGIGIRLYPKERRMVRIHAYDMPVRDIFSLFEKTGKYKFHVTGKADLSKKVTFSFIAIPDRVIFILLSEEIGLTGSEVISVVKEGRLDYIYSEKLADEK